MKHPGYVAVQHALSLRGVGRRRAIVGVLRSNEVDEVLASFPSLGATLCGAAQRYEELVAAVEADAARLAAVVDQRDFAREATRTQWGGLLFQLRSGRAATARAALEGMNVDSLAALLGLDSEPDPAAPPPTPPGDPGRPPAAAGETKGGGEK